MKNRPKWRFSDDLSANSTYRRVCTIFGCVVLIIKNACVLLLCVVQNDNDTRIDYYVLIFQCRQNSFGFVVSKNNGSFWVGVVGAWGGSGIIRVYCVN